MEKRNANRREGGRGLRLAGFCVVAGLCLAAAAPPAPTKPTETERGPMQDMSGILGEGSQLQAGKNGEFTINLGADGQMDTFRAVNDVVLLTKDIDLRCDELIYRRAEGMINATVSQSDKVIHITMRSINPGGEKAKKGEMRATCRKYEYFVNEKRHILSVNPIIYQRDEQGKETAISGDKITITQDAAGRMQMLIKGTPQIYDPKRKGELDRAREKMGGTKPTLNIDLQGAKTGQPLTGTAKTGPSAKPVKIDEGNVEALKQPKPPRVVKLEEGG